MDFLAVALGESARQETDGSNFPKLRSKDMKSIYTMPGVVRLLLSQGQVAFNDNAVKLVLISLAPLLFQEKQAEQVVSLVAAALVLPYVLFAPLVGWLNDVYSKKKVVQASLIMQVTVMGILLVSLWYHSLPGVLLVFFLLGLQSCLMSPAKRGLSGELAGTRRVGEVMGILEMLVVAGILIGSLAGGFLLKYWVDQIGDAWQSAFYAVAVLMTGCVVAWVLFVPVPARPAPSQRPFKWTVVLGHGRQVKDLWSYPVVFKAAVGQAMFYFIGGVMVLILAEVGRMLHPADARAGWVTSLMSAALGIGIIAGALIAARICREKIQTGLIPVGAVGMASSLVLLAVVPPGTIWNYAVLVLLGCTAGWFLVPLSGLLVARSPEERRGELIAGANLLTSSAGVIAVAFQALLAQVLDLPVWGQLLLLAVLVLAAGIYLVQLLPDELIRLIGMGIAALHYRVYPQGHEPFPKEGGVLLLSNHVSYVDSLILSLACPRPVRFLAMDILFKQPVTGRMLRVFGAIPISPRRAKDAIRQAATHLQDGEVVCIFPEGQLTKHGRLMEVKSGFELIARKADQQVVMVHMDGLWGSVCSFERGKLFWKWPRTWRLHIDVRFSDPIPAGEATCARVTDFWQECARDGQDEQFLARHGQTGPEPVSETDTRQKAV
ncbi:MAG: MFS transporter [Verrucomicrobiota bacterium]